MGSLWICASHWNVCTVKTDRQGSQSGHVISMCCTVVVLVEATQWKWTIYREVRRELWTA